MSKYKIHKPFIEAIPEKFRDMPLGALVKHKGKAYFYDGTLFQFPDYMPCLRSWGDERSSISVPWSEITPVEQWVPEKGEIVAVWNNDTAYITGEVTIGCYQGGNTVRPLRSLISYFYDNIARIPADMLLIDVRLGFKWWEANAEKYEAES